MIRKLGTKLAHFFTRGHRKRHGIECAQWEDLSDSEMAELNRLASHSTRQSLLMLVVLVASVSMTWFAPLWAMWLVVVLLVATFGYVMWDGARNSKATCRVWNGAHDRVYVRRDGREA